MTDEQRLSALMDELAWADAVMKDRDPAPLTLEQERGLGLWGQIATKKRRRVA